MIRLWKRHEHLRFTSFQDGAWERIGNVEWAIVGRLSTDKSNQSKEEGNAEGLHGKKERKGKWVGKGVVLESEEERKEKTHMEKWNFKPSYWGCARKKKEFERPLGRSDRADFSVTQKINTLIGYSQVNQCCTFFHAFT